MLNDNEPELSERNNKIAGIIERVIICRPKSVPKYFLLYAQKPKQKKN